MAHDDIIARSPTLVARQREVKDAASLTNSGSEILEKVLRALDIVADRSFIELRGGAAVSR